MTVERQRLLVFAGSYSEAEDSGIYVYAFDEETGTLTLTDEFAGLKNPTFLNVNADRSLLYSISETVSAEGNKIGEAAAFAIDAAGGKIRLMNREITVDSTTCHIQRDAASRYLTVTSYHGGMIGLFSIAEDGKVGRKLDVQQHAGSSWHPERQDRPHPHSSIYSPDGRYLLVSDLGLDRIVTYSVDEGKQKLIKIDEVSLHPGAGPRHLAFHPNGEYVYAINEVDSTITSFSYDAEKGRITVKDNVSTLPAGFAEDNSCAEITISADGKYLYGSNRGHDSIVVFAIDELSGLLKLVQHVSVGGVHPRHFALTPNGRYLIAANRDTDNIVTFKVDQESGKLQDTGKSVIVSKPVCVVPVYLMT
ncbi:lactonase family protein [Paenibacillus alkaliterrae]|uniref:lactonase family protein n=1 Tax=Paenibacillus alkaliterrae TaxID=320909 RepID=UPI001F376FC4|nr:lactonase family protein [Paenibacillus alkaliterrae]MCF2938243.1 lactonase family protein [Paenibacillus alkaliterrae]